MASAHRYIEHCIWIIGNNMKYRTAWLMSHVRTNGDSNTFTAQKASFFASQTFPVTYQIAWTTCYLNWVRIRSTSNLSIVNNEFDCLNRTVALKPKKIHQNNSINGHSEWVERKTHAHTHTHNQKYPLKFGVHLSVWPEKPQPKIVICSIFNWSSIHCNAS